ncbi:phosphatase PAP2 family protein [Tabrizicola piscis]|uniref:phosphatase PAP2 family protein n=1 Tax=Tabrizicola piscis TaxID=2494374 RepID=UPI0013DDA1BB|nr:phosphatase PAP2 family protein [Tabrizicola piscis]
MTVSAGDGVLMRAGSKRVLRQHSLLAGLVVAYGLIATWLAQRYALSIEHEKVTVLVMHFLTKVPQIIFFVLLWRLLHHTYVVRSEDRMAALKNDVRSFLSDRDRLFGGAIATLLMALVLIFFAQIKSLIPTLMPFSWDEYFMELDRLLHFNTDPYSLLHTVLGGHYSLSFFTGMYNVWLLVVYFALFASCFLRPDSAIRMQFLISFLLVWALGGNLLAIVFSSAGPPYYALLGLGDTFEPLMDLLRAHAATGALSVVDTQILLWDFYTAPNSINAISAFPSMHVASSTLIAIFAFRLSRFAGYVMTAFAVVIMIGSVLLGWHYAVDGYVGAFLAVLVWKAVGLLIRPTMRRMDSSSHVPARL